MFTGKEILLQSILRKLRIGLIGMTLSTWEKLL